MKKLISGIFINNFGVGFRYDNITYNFRIFWDGTKEPTISIGYQKEKKPYYLRLSLKEFRKLVLRTLKNANQS